MIHSEKAYNRVLSSFRKLRLKEKKRKLWVGILCFIVVFLSSSTITLGLESIFSFSSSVRITICVLYLVFLGMAFVYTISFHAFMLFDQKNNCSCTEGMASRFLFVHLNS